MKFNKKILSLLIVLSMISSFIEPIKTYATTGSGSSSPVITISSNNNTIKYPQTTYLGQNEGLAEYLVFTYTTQVTDLTVKYNYRFTVDFKRFTEFDYIESVYVNGEELTSWSRQGTTFIAEGLTKIPDNKVFTLSINFADTFNALSFNFGQITASLDSSLMNETNNLLSGLSGVMNNVLSAIQNMWDTLKNLPSSIAANLKAFFDNVVGAITNLGNRIKEFFDGLVQSITNLFNDLKTKLENLINSVNGFIQEIGSNIVNKLTEVINSIVNKLTELGEYIFEKIKYIFVPTEEYLETYLDNLQMLFQEIFGFLYETFDIISNIYYTLISFEVYEPIISFDGFEYMNVQIIPEFEYNLNSLLENETLLYIYDILRMLMSAFFSLTFIHTLFNDFLNFIGGNSC